MRIRGCWSGLSFRRRLRLPQLALQAADGAAEAVDLRLLVDHLRLLVDHLRPAAVLRPARLQLKALDAVPAVRPRRQLLLHLRHLRKTSS
jgi:hypothetical protein